MGLSKEIFIQDKQELLDRQDSYEAKLWFLCYQEERQRRQVLEKKIAELKRKIKN